MVGDYGKRTRLDHQPELSDGRRSWMPLYLAAFLLSVVVIEMLGDHLLAS